MNNIYHIASEEEYSTIDVVRKIISLNGIEDWESCINYTADRSGADVRYALNIEKIKKIGWKTKISFEKGINKLIEHYKKEVNKE